jgi:hypothetical protein
MASLYARESIVLDIGSRTMLSALLFAASFSEGRQPPFGTMVWDGAG